MLLIEKPPIKATIGAQEYDLNTDYRTILQAYAVIQTEACQEDKVGAALLLLFGCIPSAIEAAVAYLLWFLGCGKKEEKKSEGGEGYRPPAYAFDHDGGLIYAAFLAQYGIDLVSVTYLHWWQFMALFDGLEDGRVMTEVMRCRRTEITNDMTKGQKDYLKAMKKAYGLPLPQGVARAQSDLEKALLHGGDVRGVLGYGTKG